MGDGIKNKNVMLVATIIGTSVLVVGLLGILNSF
jgi:hypothetical protein